jgi:hypothetical protein
MHDVLLIACSARKRMIPQKAVPALERYDGVFFRVLRKWFRETSVPGLEVLILSARYGVIDAATKIPYYDQRMTAERARELAPDIRFALTVRLEQSGYRRMLVNVGRDYVPALEGIEELSRAFWASGGIGKRAQQLKQWLEGSC